MSVLEKLCRSCLLGQSFHRSVRIQGMIVFTADPQFVQQHGQFTSHGDNRALFGRLAASCGQFQSPTAQAALFSKGSQNIVGTADQQLA